MEQTPQAAQGGSQPGWIGCVLLVTATPWPWQKNANNTARELWSDVRRYALVRESETVLIPPDKALEVVLHHSLTYSF